MSDVNLSASISTNLLSLQSTNSLFNRTSQRLSTGLRVNSALDGPSSFFTARNLTNRANDFAGLKDGITQAIQTLKTADKGITAMTALVEQAKSLADQAKAASTQVSVLSGTAGTTAAIATTVLSVGFVTLTTATTFSVSVDSGATVNITLDTAKSINYLLSQINNVDSGLTASLNTVTDKLELTGTAGLKVTISSTTDSQIIFGTANVGSTTFGSTGSGSSVPTLESDYEKVMAEINQLVLDTSYKGINLLNGNNLTVNVNESTATIVVSGTTLDVTGLGFSGTNVDFSSSGNIDTAVTESKAALTKLRDTASTFSTDLSLLQARDSFTTDLVNTLKAGAGLLVNANMEEESANLLSLQTRQSLGTSALSFASQAQQSVLRLFR